MSMALIALALSTSVTFFRLSRLRAISKAYRTAHSQPFRVKIMSATATSSGVPFLRIPPIPA